MAGPITWRDVAACRERSGVDFFPFSEDIVAINRVKEVCAVCPVTDECLMYAIETRQVDGVWGGYTPRERTYLRRKWMEDVRSSTDPERPATLIKQVSGRKQTASQ
jgi:WhiB family redox-sensing transcriptional regulator